MDSIAEQFTGLKDNTGEDIYEGDIVQFHGNSDDLAIVKFGEVIGNIHKNPELVED